jgi:hypothetical protein
MSHNWQPWLYAVRDHVYNTMNEDETSVSVIAGCDLVLMVQFRYFSSENLQLSKVEEFGCSLIAEL